MRYSLARECNTTNTPSAPSRTHQSQNKQDQGLMDFDLGLDFDFEDIFRFCDISVLVIFLVLVTLQFW